MTYLSRETNIYKHLLREHGYQEEEDNIALAQGQVDDWDKHWRSQHVRKHMAEALGWAVIEGFAGGHAHVIPQWDQDVATDRTP